MKKLFYVFNISLFVLSSFGMRVFAESKILDSDKTGVFTQNIDVYDSYNNPMFSPDNSKVLFSGSNYDEVYFYNFNNAEITKITSGKSSGYKYNWSADSKYIGCKLLIEKAGDEGFLQTPVVYNTVTQQTIALSEPVLLAGIPSFSQSGKVAFTIDKEIVVLDESYREIKRVSIPTYVNITPISPDGTHVLYNDYEEQIWMVNINTLERIQLTNNADNAFFSPAWSPDGTKVLVNSVAGKIFVIDLQASNVAEIDSGRNPSWYNDSKHVFYHKIESNEVEVLRASLNVARYDGANKTQFSAGKFVGDCAVSSDGKMILYKDFEKKSFVQAPIEALNVSNTQVRFALGNAQQIGMGIPKLAVIDGEIQARYKDAITRLSPGIAASKTIVKISGVPYINQGYDTVNSFNGWSACNATSALMVIGYRKILPYHDVTVTKWNTHTSHYGWYVSTKYTWKGYTFDSYACGSNSCGYGGFGYICRNNWADTKGYMRDYLKKHGFATSIVDWSTSWSKLVSECKAKNPFVILNSITSAGHYIVAIGYFDNQHTAVFNDPAGNRNKGTYGSQYDGTNAYYDYPGYSNGYKNLVTAHCFIYGRGYVSATAPGVPSTFSVDYNESGYATLLKWAAVSGATAYKVGRRPSGGTWTYWDNLTTANATGIGWPAMYHTHGAGKYDFAVQAKNTVGSSAWKYVNAVVVPDQVIPATPSGLTAVSVSASQIKISWAAVTGASGYTVYCSSTKAEVEDKCYKKTPVGDGQTWSGLAYITDGDRSNTTYASAPVAAQANVWVTLSPAVELHKYSFRFFDGDNRIYENVFARWYDTAGAYHNPHGWRAYRTGGAYRLSATTDVKCTKLGLSFASGMGNTTNAQNHVTVMEAHGGYLAKTTVTTYTASGLKAGTAYYFRVDAYKSVSPETLSYSSVIVATNTLGSADTIAPAVPTLVSPANAASLASSVPVFDWSDVTDPSGVKYKLQVDNNPDFTSLVINQGTLTASTYSPTAGLANGTYYWRVAAYDNTGNSSSWSAARSVALNVTGTDTTPPTNPTSIQAWASDTKTTVIANDTWQKVDAGPYFEFTGANDAGTGVSGYAVYWGTSSAGDPGNVQTIVNQAPVKYFAMPAVAEKPCYLRVKTRDNAGNWSEAVTLFTLKYDNIPPLVPSLIYPANAALFTVSQVSFTCSAVSDPSGCTYMLQIDNAVGFTSPEVSVLTLTAAEIVNTKYQPSYAFTEGTYYWRVGTKDGVGNTGNWSTARAFYIDTAGPQPITSLTATLESGGDIKLSWASARDTVGQISGYKVYRSEVMTSVGIQINTGNESAVAGYIDAGTGLTEDKTYYYVVMPVDNLGNVTQAGNNQVSILCKKVGVSLSEIAAVPPVFSPNNDGLKDAVTIYYTLSPAGNVTIKVMDYENTVVRTIIENQARTAGKNYEVWAGLDDTNDPIINSSRYFVRITAVDTDANVSTPRDVEVEIDVTPPEVSSFTVTNSAISPNNDGAYDSTVVMYAISETAKVTISVKNDSGVVVKTIVSDVIRTAGRNSETWDGRNDSDEVVPDGKYSVVFSAVDDCGNICEEEVIEVVVDVTSGWIIGYVYNETTGYGNVAENRVGNAVLSLNTSINTSSSSEPEKKGLYGFYALAEGEYEMMVSARGYQSKTVNVTVEAGKIKWNSIGLVYVGKIDNVPPVIEHTPYSYIGLVGNKVKIIASVVDDVIVDTVKIVYKFVYVDNTASEEKERTFVSFDTIYTVDIPADEFTSAIASVQYQIFAQDGDGNETVSPSSGQYYEVTRRSSVEKTVAATGGRVSIADGNPDDGEMAVQLPSGVSDTSFTIKIMQKDVTALPMVKNSDIITKGAVLPVAAYEIDMNQKTLASPAELTLIYFDVDDDGIVDGTDIDEAKLQIFWYDGDDWRYVGGVVNPSKNTVTVKVGHFSLYGIFPAVSLSGNAEQYKPKEKIITPNNDGSNDFACFNGIHNYWLSQSIQGTTEGNWVKVYDLQNKLVRTVESIDVWDGRDMDGNFVENGIYIYQFVIGDKTVAGTIIVAK
ncbi:MAG: FlgD immunoglobulin-like domain containing protein [Elusimicrobiota bacterium]